MGKVLSGEIGVNSLSVGGYGPLLRRVAQSIAEMTSPLPHQRTSFNMGYSNTHQSIAIVSSHAVCYNGL